MNAIKFSHRGGRIEIVAFLIESEDQTNVQISVSDLGIGMTEEVKESLFTMFGRLTKQVDRR